MKDLKAQLLDGRWAPREFLMDGWKDSSARAAQAVPMPWWAGRALSKAWNAKACPKACSGILQLQEVFGQLSHMLGFTGRCRAEPGAGVGDPCLPLPFQSREF